MEVAHWIVEHWFDLLQTAGIVSGFGFAVHAIHTEAETRKMSNLIALNQERNAIWKEFYGRPELSRVREERVALETKPLSHEERLFVISLILHLSVVYRAMKAKMLPNVERLAADIRATFSLPIPRIVWNDVKTYQDKDFAAFVESALDQSRRIE